MYVTSDSSFAVGVTVFASKYLFYECINASSPFFVDKLN